MIHIAQASVEYSRECPPVVPWRMGKRGRQGQDGMMVQMLALERDRLAFSKGDFLPSKTEVLGQPSQCRSYPNLKLILKRQSTANVANLACQQEIKIQRRDATKVDERKPGVYQALPINVHKQNKKPQYDPSLSSPLLASRPAIQYRTPSPSTDASHRHLIVSTTLGKR